jgi:hypothetical protein
MIRTRFIYIFISFAMMSKRLTYLLTGSNYRGLLYDIYSFFSTACILLTPLRSGDDKSSAFPICSTTKRIFLGRVLKKLEQRSHKCVELGGGGGIRKYIFFNHVSCVFFTKTKTYQPPSYQPLVTYP